MATECRSKINKNVGADEHFVKNARIFDGYFYTCQMYGFRAAECRINKNIGSSNDRINEDH